MSGNEDEVKSHDAKIFEIEDRTLIREKICNLSFEDLLQMKEKIGSKLYNETIFGSSNGKRKKGIKRINKNRPRELSSRLKQKHMSQELNNSNILPAKRSFPRDPRFDPLCGQFDDNTFKANYSFINDIRQKEKKQLEKELKNCTDERKKTIMFLLQRMDNQLREAKKKTIEDKRKFEVKKNIRDKLKKGEKPIFKKKSVMKLESLIEKYENLKKTNKLQKVIEKKSKKLSSRDRRNFTNSDLL